jgi:hypothetical protein
MTDARTSQTSVEQWSQGDPVAQSTQAALEMWGSLAVGAGMAVVSQVAVEAWAAVVLSSPAGGQTAVTVNTS